jgi:hypothetical protein
VTSGFVGPSSPLGVGSKFYDICRPITQRRPELVAGDEVVNVSQMLV